MTTEHEFDEKRGLCILKRKMGWKNLNFVLLNNPWRHLSIDIYCRYSMCTQMHCDNPFSTHVDYHIKQFSVDFTVYEVQLNAP